ncbi:MAG: hypothetical protein Q8L47_05635 [bacterium]|nr:hypothetical protein [bacterium]
MKTFTFFALISISVSFVLFLFLGNSNPGVNSFEVGGAPNIFGTLQPMGMFSNLATGVSRVLGFSIANTDPKQTIDATTNLTEIFGQIMAGGIIEGNPKGPQQIDGQDSLIIPESLNLADPKLRQVFNLYKNKITSPTVDENKFNIISTTKKEDLEKYFMTIENGYAELYKDRGFIEDAQDITGILKNFEIIGRINEDYLKILYSMPVPAVFKEFHKKTTIYTIAEINIISGALDIENDPLKALWMKNLHEGQVVKKKELMNEEISFINQYGLFKK